MVTVYNSSNLLKLQYDSKVNFHMSIFEEAKVIFQLWEIEFFEEASLIIRPPQTPNIDNQKRSIIFWVPKSELVTP